VSLQERIDRARGANLAGVASPEPEESRGEREIGRTIEQLRGQGDIASLAKRSRLGVLEGTPETGRGPSPTDALLRTPPSSAGFTPRINRQGNQLADTPPVSTGVLDRTDISGLSDSPLARAQASLDIFQDRLRSAVGGAEPGSLESRAALAVSRAIPDVIGRPAEAAGLVFAGGVLPADVGREVQEKAIPAALEAGLRPDAIAALDVLGLLDREAAITLLGVPPARAGAAIGQVAARGVRATGAARGLQRLATRRPGLTAFAEGAATFGPEGAVLGAASQLLEEGEINANTALVAGIGLALGGVIGGAVRSGELQKALRSGDPEQVFRVIPEERLDRVAKKINENAELTTLDDGTPVFRFPDGEEIGVSNVLSDLVIDERFNFAGDEFPSQTPGQRAAGVRAADRFAGREGRNLPAAIDETGPLAEARLRAEARRGMERGPGVRPEDTSTGRREPAGELPPGRGPNAEPLEPAARVAKREIEIGGERFNVVDNPGRGGVLLDTDGNVVAALPDNGSPIVVADAADDSLLSSIETLLAREAPGIRGRGGFARLPEITADLEVGAGVGRTAETVGRTAASDAVSGRQRGATGFGGPRPQDPELAAAVDRVRANRQRLLDDRTVESIRSILPESERAQFDLQVQRARQDAIRDQGIDAAAAALDEQPGGLGRLRSETGAARVPKIEASAEVGAEVGRAAEITGRAAATDTVTGRGAAPEAAEAVRAATGRGGRSEAAEAVRQSNIVEKVREGLDRGLGLSRKSRPINELTPEEQLAEAMGSSLREAAFSGWEAVTKTAKLNFSRLENAVPRIFGDRLGGQYVTMLRQTIERALPRKGRNFEDVRAVWKKHGLKKNDFADVWNAVDKHGFKAETGIIDDLVAAAKPGGKRAVARERARGERLSAAIAEMREVFDRGLRDFAAQGGQRNGQAAAGSGRFLPMMLNDEGVKLVRLAQSGRSGEGRVAGVAEQMVRDAAKRGQTITVEEALVRIKSLYENSLHSDFGYYTRERVRLPDEFIDKKVNMWSESFFERDALFLEGLRTFGENGKRAKAIFTQMKEIDAGATDLVENVHKMTFGGASPEPSFSREVWGLVSNGLTSTKLSSPFTTIRQIGQRFINTVDLPFEVQFTALVRDLPPVVSRFVSNAASLAERAGLDKTAERLTRQAAKQDALAREARSTGGVQAKATAAQDIIKGRALSGISDRVLRATGFLPAEEGNQISTIIAAKRGVELLTSRFIDSAADDSAIGLRDYFSALREGQIPVVREGGKFRIDPRAAVQGKRLRTIERLAGGENRGQRLIESRRGFEEVGGDLRDLEVNQLTRRVLDRVNRLTDDIGLQRELVEAWRRGDSMAPEDLNAVAILANEDRNFAMDVLTEPIKWNQNGAFRTVFKFKPFAAKQFEFVRRAVFQEAVKGNLAPASKIMMAGGAVAEIWNLARDVLFDRQESITVKLLTDPSQLDSKEEWALQIINHFADGAVIGIVTDLVWGWDGFVGGPLWTTLRDTSFDLVGPAKNMSFPTMFATANEVLGTQVPAVGLSQSIIKKAEEAFREDNFFPEYRRARTRAREFASDIDQQSKASEVATDVLVGRRGFLPTPRTLRFQYAFDNVASGDKNAARRYLRSVLSEPETAEERETVERSVQAALRSRAPLGPLTSARDWRNSDKVKQLFRDVGPEEAKELRDLQVRYLREATRVLREAKKEVRRNRGR